MDTGGAAARAVAPPKKFIFHFASIFRFAGEVVLVSSVLRQLQVSRREHRARNSVWEHEISPAQREHSPRDAKEMQSSREREQSAGAGGSRLVSERRKEIPDICCSLSVPVEHSQTSTCAKTVMKNCTG